MGAKTAMTLALRSPDLVANIVAVDNAPVDAALKNDFGGYVTKQSEADTILQEYAEVWYQLLLLFHFEVLRDGQSLAMPGYVICVLIYCSCHD
jgi:pimeloyl-ACP methyl ester carboxylesterase